MTLQSPTATLIPLISSSDLTGCGYPGLLDRKNCSDMCPRGSRTLDFLHARRAPYPLGQVLRVYFTIGNLFLFKMDLHSNALDGLGQVHLLMYTRSAYYETIIPRLHDKLHKLQSYAKLQSVYTNPNVSLLFVTHTSSTTLLSSVNK